MRKTQRHDRILYYFPPLLMKYADRILSYSDIARSSVFIMKNNDAFVQKLVGIVLLIYVKIND
jgi:hypothetical protein